MISKGDKEIREIHVKVNGDVVDIQNVFKGDKEIWASLKVFDLGIGTSFDVGELVPNIDISKLSVDDFFFTECSLYWYDGAHCPAWTYDPPRDMGDCHGSHDSRSVSGSFVKNYDNTTGVLNCNYKVRSSLYTTHVFLIPNANKYIGKKLINLGTSKTYDLTTIKDFQTLTVNNFLQRTLPNVSDGIDCYAYNCPYGLEYAKAITNNVLRTGVDTNRSGLFPTETFYIESRYLQ